MPKITRSNEEIDKVREQILDGAMEILATEGYESLSMNKVGQRMDMTAANLYNYYENKNELFIAIHKKTFGMLHDRMREYVDAVDDPREKIAQLVRAFVEFGTTNVHVYDIMFNRPIPQYTDYIGTPQESMAFDEYQSSLKAFYFATETAAHYIALRPELKGADPKYMTIRLLSALHGIVTLYNSRILFEIDSNPDEVLKRIQQDLLRQIDEGRL